MRSTKPARGRPKADPEALRNDVFRVAMEVLVKHGHQKTTSLSIAQGCGISKQTLYKLFSSKEALFLALLQNRTMAVNDILETALEDKSLDLDEVLTRFGKLVLGVLCSDVSVAIHRACMASAGAGELGLSLAYFEQGQGPVRQKLVAVLLRARTDGIIDFDDVDETFQTLVGLYYGDLQVRRLLGVVCAPDEKQISDKIEKAVVQFKKLFTS